MVTSIEKIYNSYDHCPYNNYSVNHIRNQFQEQKN